MLLTIFTPAYNRGKLLPRLFESLQKQSCHNFEWLIVDDGSTDDTKTVVAGFKTSLFPIRYIKKENGGKHTAHNLGITEAKGAFFFCVDSDDWLPQNSVGDIINSISNMQENDYALLGYKTLENGKMICKSFRDNLPHKGFYELTETEIGGEYAIVMKTELIKTHPFPVVNGERFSTECILYDVMEIQGFTMCPCPHILTVCEYQEDGLTGTSNRILIENPTCYQIYNMQRIDLAYRFKKRIHHALSYHAFKHLSKNKTYLYHGKHRFIVALTSPLGPIAALYYKIILR